MRTHFKPKETFQYTFFTTSHPPGAKKGFVNGEALRLLRTNSSIKTFKENITTFKKHLLGRGYPQNLIKNTLLEVKFQERTQALLQRNKTKKRILPFIIWADRPTRLRNTWFGFLAFVIFFALTSMSLSERPFLYDIMGGSLKI